MENCEHYDRECDYLAACCDEFFHCKFCHDKVKFDEERDISKCHKMIRSDTERVRCRRCNFTQSLQQNCQNCGVCMGAYFCSICHLYDSNLSKHIYHCEKCGICRVGPKENYFHCDTCEACLGIALQGSHTCRPGMLKANCAVCQEDMFTSREATISMKCGHFIHRACLRAMIQNNRYSCPLCFKNVVDMSLVYQELDEEIAQTQMPEEYKNLEFDVLCNDCLHKSNVRFHFLGMKCPNCGSYNTVRN